MTRRVVLVQLGIGQVGRAVARLVREQSPDWRQRYGIEMWYSALSDSSGFALAPAAGAHSSVGADATMAFAETTIARRAAGTRLAAMPDALPADRWRMVLDRALDDAGGSGNLYVLDCASGPGTTPLLLVARTVGAHVVLANKDPLAGPMAHFAALTDRARGGSLLCSATVGAGLPVVATLAALVASGDPLRALDARASGSLGFLCDRLCSGESFDEAVRAAVANGYTEPDPRLDLSGFDVARKLLILARVAGFDCELSDVRVESLVPPGADTFDRETFLGSLASYREFLAERATRARTTGHVLRYIGHIGQDGQLSAGLIALPPDDAMARGGGPENVFRLRTVRYDAYPLTISGPGAGVDVTAGAVVADLLRSLEVLPC